MPYAPESQSYRSKSTTDMTKSTSATPLSVSNVVLTEPPSCHSVVTVSTRDILCTKFNRFTGRNGPPGSNACSRRNGSPRRNGYPRRNGSDKRCGMQFPKLYRLDEPRVLNDQE